MYSKIDSGFCRAMKLRDCFLYFKYSSSRFLIFHNRNMLSTCVTQKDNIDTLRVFYV